MHTDTSPGRLIPFLSTPNRVLRAARRTAETILPRASDTNSAPQEPLKKPLRESRRDCGRCGLDAAAAHSAHESPFAFAERRRPVEANDPTRRNGSPKRSLTAAFRSTGETEFSTRVDETGPHMWKTPPNCPQAVEKIPPPPRWASSPGSACLALACRV